jgi:hypothetical protein
MPDEWLVGRWSLGERGCEERMDVLCTWAVKKTGGMILFLADRFSVIFVPLANKGLFGYDRSVPLPHTNDRFPSVRKILNGTAVWQTWN